MKSLILKAALVLSTALLLTSCGEKNTAGQSPASETSAAAAPAERTQSYYAEASEARGQGNYEKSFELFTKSDELGESPCASFFVGIAYENGEGRPADTAKAVEWYQKSLGKGCVEAGNRLKDLQKK